MNPGLISCHYTLEESFVTSVKLEKLPTGFEAGLLVGVRKLSRNPPATNRCKAYSPTTFTALPWLIPIRSEMPSIMSLQSITV